MLILSNNYVATWTGESRKTQKQPNMHVIKFREAHTYSIRGAVLFRTSCIRVSHLLRLLAQRLPCKITLLPLPSSCLLRMRALLQHRCLSWRIRNHRDTNHCRKRLPLKLSLFQQLEYGCIKLRTWRKIVLHVASKQFYPLGSAPLFRRKLENSLNYRGYKDNELGWIVS